MKNKLGNLGLFLLTITPLILMSCDNSLDGSDVKSADFSVSSESSYLTTSLDFVASDSVGGNVYSWDFGDGSKLMGGHRVSHIYKKSGAYFVNLTINGLSSSKTIHVNPGTLSFKIINNSSKFLDILTYIDNYEDGSVKRFSVYSQHQSDTIYGLNDGFILADGYHIFGISLFVENAEYTIPDLVWFEDFHHYDFLITDSTRLVARTTHGLETIVLLKDL
jgi:hypothetical protein